ncbi:ABC transporter permease [Arthrobacter antioxidans]|uniref:ABC transporter permease n=1 Tax=Arthrobacter antioxidans TaxID=2895818 RepID=UPI001FFEEBED|nr:ABC transporter permease [Arthrobacter antioxidans]
MGAGAVRGSAVRVHAVPVSVASMARDRLVHAVRALWRTQVVLIFTFVLPLLWLFLLGLLAGNDAVGPDGVRVMQFAAPVAIAMGTFFATLPPVAIAVAEARETGVLKRLRGTPLPAWGYFFGQVGAALLFALGSLVVTVLLGVLLYDVRLRTETLLATAATLLLGAITFSAVGLAIGSLSRTASIAEAASIGSAVVLSFISGLFFVGAALPAWLDTVASVFPLKPYADSLRDQFNPYLPGSGWNPADLAVIAAWLAAGTLVGLGAFRWERHRSRSVVPAHRPSSRSPSSLSLSSGVAVSKELVAVTVRRPPPLALLAAQSGAALRGAARRPGDVFFSVVMPVGLFALLVTVQPGVTLADGRPAALVIGASMVTWGAGVALFMNLAEGIARARDTGLLKRMRGTPLPVVGYLAGRTVAGFTLTLVILAAILLLGALAYGLRIGAAGLLLGLVVLLAGCLSLAACGFLLTTLVPSARAVGSVGLAVLFLLSFFSDVFLNEGPEWMGTVGSLFPLKHLQNGLVAAWDPAGAPVPWPDILVLAVWAAVAGMLAVGRFRRQPGTP